MMFKMAHQQITCVFTVLIILLSKDCQSQQPACGRSVVNSRITGGQLACPGSWPWHVAFEYRDTFFCQGSLINNQWVLTAAQCSQNSYLSGSVAHLGMQSQTGSNPNEVNRTVDHFICHKDYYNYNNDICLVKLSAPVNFTDYIQPVCLASENSTFYDGTTSWVTGLGYDSYWFQPNNLQDVKISIIGNSRCRCYFEDYYYYYYFKISESTMCAGTESELKGTTYGDQGAALVTKKGSVWVQSGIASYGEANYIRNPGIYTRVSKYQKWISERVTGIQPGFVNFSSTASDSDFNYTCPTPPPITPYTFPDHTYPFPEGIFDSGVKLTPLTSLSALVLFLHVFVGTGGL